jgi:hypothetical protein
MFLRVFALKSLRDHEKILDQGAARRKATFIRQLTALTGLRNLANVPALATGDGSAAGGVATAAGPCPNTRPVAGLIDNCV